MSFSGRWAQGEAGVGISAGINGTGNVWGGVRRPWEPLATIGCGCWPHVLRILCIPRPGRPVVEGLVVGEFWQAPAAQSGFGPGSLFLIDGSVLIVCV